MAEKPSNNKKITLIDGTEIEVRPLKLSLLKPFMTKFSELAGVSEDNDKSIDILLDCVQIAMKQYKPELSESKINLEELLDLPTVYELIDAASGIDKADTALMLNTLGK